MFDLVTGSRYSLLSIFSDEIPTMSLRLCFNNISDTGTSSYYTAASCQQYNFHSLFLSFDFFSIANGVHLRFLQLVTIKPKNSITISNIILKRNTMTPVSNWIQFYGHHHKFVDCYEIAISQMALDLFPFVLIYLSNHT
jgi:hypothetical protein